MNDVRPGYVRPVDFKHGHVDMTHGGGGRAMAQLIDELFLRAFDNDWLRQANDQAAFAVSSGRMVMATDSHVVSPLFFPGGDIGCLSVHGTINDVAMAGAVPLYLAAGFILEEGFPLADLKRVVESMAAAARDAGVPVITGDTKVVERGKGDGVFITTTGVGVVPAGIAISGDAARPGDRILVSGTMGDHGVAIMSLRENLTFETTIRSDTAALHGLVAAMVAAVPGIHCLRDPTRGGLATTLNELASQSGCGMVIAEKCIPVNGQVNAACEFLGLDPLYVANEGKLVAICAAGDADALLAAMRAHPLGKDAAIIGEVIADPHHFVQMDTSFGGRRVVDWLTGEQLPPDLLMRILFLTHAFNSLAQRLYVDLAAAGHDVTIEFDINDAVTEESVALARPDLIVAPFLKRRIPEPVWRSHRCIVIHPGILGDRGPSALDWAIVNGETTWGVTAVEANADMDAGDIWASVEFPMRDASKSSLYRNEVTEAAVVALRLTLERIARGESPQPLALARPFPRGMLRPAMRQQDRAIDWRADNTVAVLRKIRAADGFPGVLDDVRGDRVHLFGAHAEGRLREDFPLAEPGAVIARRDGAILRATTDGAVWITHLRRAGSDTNFKLPAAMVLEQRIADVPEAPLAADAVVDYPTWRPIRYEEAGAVGYLHFPFCNGAMGTAQCESLRQAIRAAKARPTRVLVLMGGPDFWSNGIHLNLIEAAAHPAEESLRNINAMNDLVREIIVADRQVTIAAMQGNAGAGGAFLALSADHAWARDGIVVNPHYKGMGNLYGSEYWTYLLPRRVGADAAQRMTQGRLPIGAAGAAALRLVDDHFGATPAAFCAEVEARAQAIAHDPAFTRLLHEKNLRRRTDEARKPLETYRDEELARMQQNFFGFDPSYHVARDHFVRKVPRSRTPLHLARHRTQAWST